MKSIVITIMLFASFKAAFSQTIPTTEQCQTTAKILLALSPVDIAKLQRHMTAGDELVYSTQIAKCLEHYPLALSRGQNETLDRAQYQFDADVIRRMFDFMQRHRLSDQFNDEEEARKAK